MIVAELKARLNKVNEMIWDIEMADFIRGEERIRYENLKAERYDLEYRIYQMEREGA